MEFEYVRLCHNFTFTLKIANFVTVGFLTLMKT
jgi:hypothetical protein